MLANSRRYASAAFFSLLTVVTVAAQNPQLQEKVAQIKQGMAANKKLLAQYTWQEQQTVSLKGEVKKQQSFQVRMGPDGKPQKTPIGPVVQPAEASGGGLKRRIVEKKTEEFKDYARQIGALAQSYASPDPERLQEAYQQGNVNLSPAGAPGQLELVIHNYVKSGDSVTMIVSTSERALQSLQISSYLDQPSDAVKISAQFARVPDGPNHVAHMVVNGVTKQLTVNIENTNYRHL